MLPKPIRYVYYWISKQGKIGYALIIAFNIAFFYSVKLLRIRAKKDLTCLTVISHKYKFIYIGIPKTATRSFMDVFTQNHALYEAEWRETAQGFQTALRDHPDYFKFSFARNPYARILSCYNSKIADAVPGKRARIMSFYKNLKPGMGFGEFAQWLNTDEGGDAFADRHWLSQHEFLCDETGTNLCDFIGRYEKLDEDWKTVCEKIGMPHTPLPHKGFKSGANKGYADAFDAQSKAEIDKRYAQDFKLLGYKF